MKKHNARIVSLLLAITLAVLGTGYSFAKATDEKAGKVESVAQGEGNSVSEEPVLPAVLYGVALAKVADNTPASDMSKAGEILANSTSHIRKLMSALTA